MTEIDPDVEAALKSYLNGEMSLRQLAEKLPRIDKLNTLARSIILDEASPPRVGLFDGMFLGEERKTAIEEFPLFRSYLDGRWTMAESQQSKTLSPFVALNTDE